MALSKLTHESFDCILLDLFLPDSPGLENLWRLRSSYPDTPVVMLAGAKDDLVESAAVKTGAQDYLVKGESDGRMILKTIQHAIDRHAREKRTARRLTDGNKLSKMVHWSA